MSVLRTKLIVIIWRYDNQDGYELAGKSQYYLIYELSCVIFVIK